ncbi:LAQU0S05e02608g1_1 [Lachancea quebecensis]|uniref:Spindle pole body component n=1 Tax=Lachancea quebecensis TaxID=1654605 RepID=A0A0P1KR26_9SACH|nr:LAQU0S05e02608g1_1 [Lachancea quebecensis]
MELENEISLVTSEMVSASLPSALLRPLINDIIATINSPAASGEGISMVLKKFKELTDISHEQLPKWQKLENVLRLIASSSSSEEALAYVRLVRTVMDDALQRSPFNAPEPPLSFNSLEKHDSIMTPVKNSLAYAESFENIDRYSDRRSILSSAYRGHLRETKNTASLASLSDPYYSGIPSEEEMLKSVPYTLLATTSHLFKFDKGSVRIPENVPNGESGILHMLFEVALLYQFLRKRIEDYKASGTLSPLKTAFLAHINTQLHHYMGTVNTLSKNPQIQSLRALYIELYHFIFEFRIYHGFIADFQSLRGDQLLSKMHSLKNHGDILVKEISTSAHRSLASLYYEYVINWLTRGQLEAHQEFFVEAAFPSQHNVATVRYSAEKVPSSIPRITADEIFMIGKTRVFLERDCREIQWVNDSSQKYSSIYRSLTGEDSVEFQSIVHSHYIEVISFCRKVLEEKYNFSGVLELLKNVLLMGKGDFIDQMIENSSEFLKEPSVSLPSYKLTRCLQESIKQSSLRKFLEKPYLNPIVNGIDARVLEMGRGSVGWDVFTLDYLPAKPLTFVLDFNHSGGRKEYLRLFNFLWRIKKNNFFFQEQWLRNNSLMRDFKRLRRNQPLVRDVMKKMDKINALKHNVQHFNKKIEAYCFQSIIDRNFRNIQKKLSMEKPGSGTQVNITTLKSGLKVANGILRPKSQLLQQLGDKSGNNTCHNTQYTIDELKMMHDDYLQEMLDHELLDSSNKHKKLGALTNQHYPSSLIVILGEIFEFVLQYSELNKLVHELLIQLSLQSEDGISALLSQLNELLGRVVSRYRWIQKTCYYFIKDLKADGDTELFNVSRILR